MKKNRLIVLLRAVNVGGRVLRMAAFRDVLLELGFSDPQTLLQSGNAVIGADGAAVRRGSAGLEARIEKALTARCGLEADTFVRTANEWDALIAANPFPEACADPSHLVLTTLRETPEPAAIAALQASIKGRERVRAGERALYVVYPAGIGDSKLTNVLIERTLGTRGTARNWNTVLKLQALANT